MNRIQKLAVATTIAAMVGLTGCSSSPEPTPAATSEASLAETVWSQVEENFPDGIPPTNQLIAVTETEDISTGDIRVYVQLNLTDDERVEFARVIYYMGAMNNTDLQTVVVRDATGLDSNHFRSDFGFKQ